LKLRAIGDALGTTEETVKNHFSARRVNAQRIGGAPMSGERKILRCDDVAPLLVFYTCDEVSAEEREQIAAHLRIAENAARSLCKKTRCAMRSGTSTSRRPV